MADMGPSLRRADKKEGDLIASSGISESEVLEALRLGAAAADRRRFVGDRRYRLDAIAAARQRLYAVLGALLGS